MTCMCIRYIEITLIVSIETCKEVTQLVSTPNKRSPSREMKIDLKRVGLYRRDGLDTLEDQRWTVKFNIHTSADQWSVSRVGMRWLLQLSQMCKDTFSHLCEVLGDEGMTLLNSCLGVKELAYYYLILNFGKQLNSVGFWPYRLWLSIWVYVEWDLVWKSQYFKLG